MADAKISALTAATDLASAVIPIVQGGANKKAASTLFLQPAMVPFTEPVTVLTPAASIELSRAGSQSFTFTPDQATAIALGTAGSGVITTVLYIVQGATPYAVSLPAGIMWIDSVAGAVSAVANKTSVVVFTTVSGVGTYASAFTIGVPA